MNNGWRWKEKNIWRVGEGGRMGGIEEEGGMGGRGRDEWKREG